MHKHSMRFFFGDANNNNRMHWLISFLRFYLFIWERESMSWRQRMEAEAEREKQTRHWAGGLTRDLIPGPWDHNLSWRQTLNPLSHPGSLVLIIFFQVCLSNLSNNKNVFPLISNSYLLVKFSVIKSTVTFWEPK